MLEISLEGLPPLCQIVYVWRVEVRHRPSEPAQGQLNRDFEGVETHCKQVFRNESQECDVKLALFALKAWLLGILTSTTLLENNL